MAEGFVITGATGFVVSNVTRHLAEVGHDVVAADLVPPDHALVAYWDGLPGRVTFRPLDVADAAAVNRLLDELRPRGVIHGAAITAIPPDVERERFVRTVEVNVLGTLNVLAALRGVGAGRIVVVSSGSIYGPRADSEPVVEDDPGNPKALYPITKWAAESLARRFAEVSDLDLGVVRLASPFGPFERDTGSRPLLSAIHDWALAGLRGEAIHVYGPLDTARDVVHVADVASGIAAVLLAKQLPHRIYNVGWGRSATSDEILASLAKIIPGLSFERLTDEPSPWAGGPNGTRGPLSSDRLREDFGWRPRYDLDSGLAAYVDWLRRSGAVKSV